MCAPSCLTSACPSDVPAGTTAHPQCALQNPSGTMKLCALICDPSDTFSSQCGPATCAVDAQQPTIGICTYAAAGKDSHAPLFALGPKQAASIVI
jgi:hypothetical protein